MEEASLSSKGYLQIARDVRTRNRLAIRLIEDMCDALESSGRPPLLGVGPTAAYYPADAHDQHGAPLATALHHVWARTPQNLLYSGPRRLPPVMWVSNPWHSAIRATTGKALAMAAEAWTSVEARTRRLRANRAAVPQLRVERHLTAELALSIDPSTRFPQSQRDEGHTRGTRAARILPLSAGQSATNAYYTRGM